MRPTIYSDGAAPIEERAPGAVRWGDDYPFLAHFAAMNAVLADRPDGLFGRMTGITAAQDSCRQCAHPLEKGIHTCQAHGPRVVCAVDHQGAPCPGYPNQLATLDGMYRVPGKPSPDEGKFHEVIPAPFAPRETRQLFGGGGPF